MVTVTVARETGNSVEFGYGVYMNAYVTFDDFPDDIPVLYASECVPFGNNSEENLEAAAVRVREAAIAKAKRDYQDGI